MVLQEGQTLGQYRILQQLGQGGMATVYKAYHPGLDRHVAIKIMHQAFMEDPAFLTRFEREAQIVGRLEHLNIVPVHDYAEFSNQPYLVMKYIEGSSLKALLKEGPLPLDELLRIMRRVADALDYAHRQGVLHRDIKPSNIMLDLNRVPYLADFGLARIVQAGESTLSQDMVLGTPHYISPEQALGRSDVSSKADLYSFGVLLYELIVGRVPFLAETPYAVIHDHIYRPVPLPSAVNPELPVQIDLILNKALAKEPADRYSSAVAMMDDLEAGLREANLTELNPERDDLAGTSLLRLRQAFPMDDRTVTPSMSGIPAPTFSPSISQPGTATIKRVTKPPRYGKRWVLGGCLVLVFIGVASGITIARTLATLDTIDMSDSEVLTTTELLLLSIPDLKIAEAREQTSTNPADEALQAALTLALWEEERRAEARSVFQAALEESDNAALLALSSAKAASDRDLHDLAELLYIQLLERTDDRVEAFAEVRIHAGSYFYEQASQAGELGSLEVRRIANQLQGESALLMQTMLARNLITQERYQAAETALRQVLNQDSDFAEAHLVLGELYAALGDNDAAQDEWDSLFDLSTPVPLWVRERAATLISNNP